MVHLYLVFLFCFPIHRSITNHPKANSSSSRTNLPFQLLSYAMNGDNLFEALLESMSRKLLLALMLFVLLWTGTLLHDMGEPDQLSVSQAGAAAENSHCTILSATDPEPYLEGHLHDAVVASRLDPKEICVQPQTPVWHSDFIVTFNRLHLLAEDSSQRGPPKAQPACQPATRLYIINRALLI